MLIGLFSSYYRDQPRRFADLCNWLKETRGDITATYQALANDDNNKNSNKYNNNTDFYMNSVLTASNSIFLTLNLSLWLATMGRIDSIATFSPDKPTVTKRKLYINILPE